MKTLEQLNKELGTSYTEADLQARAMEEFYCMAYALREKNIFVADLVSPPETPDAVFPNNWFSLHEGNTLVLYPMCASSRRRERQIEKLLECLVRFHPKGTRVITLTYEEGEDSNRYLEGTGSMVLDRVAHSAYAIESPRTTRSLFEKWCGIMEYEPILFEAFDRDGQPLYHTNVVMGIGEGFAVVCFDAIHDKQEQLLVERRLLDSKKVVIPISMDQMYAYCGNLLQVHSPDGKKHIVLSRTSYNALHENEKDRLMAFGEFLPVDIPVIEGIGGGSARCMIAEIF